jgi:hypothetical protein
VTTEEWVAANRDQVAEALQAAQDELYALLGGKPDPEREREALAQEVARLHLKWRPGS